MLKDDPRKEVQEHCNGHSENAQNSVKPTQTTEQGLIHMEKGALYIRRAGIPIAWYKAQIPGFPQKQVLGEGKWGAYKVQVYPRE